jgi:hypothetical protein
MSSFAGRIRCAAWYLAACAPAKKWRARWEVKDRREYRRLFPNGSKWIDENLFNGEYYIQKIRGVSRASVPKAFRRWCREPGASRVPARRRLSVDQLVGHLAGRRLGRSARYRKIVKRSARSRSTIQAESAAASTLGRTCRVNDEAALVVCDYGRGKRPEVPFPYFSETGWNGMEYSTAALMMYRGMIAEGLTVVENVRLRHDGEKRNPWNEPECGHHYARALASWGPMLALSGFLYDRPGKRLQAKPRIGAGNFRSFWSTGTGWGIFSQVLRDGQLQFALTVKAGTLVARTVTLPRLGGGSPRSSVTAGGREVAHQVRRGEGEIVVKFASDVNLAESDPLVVVV